MSVQSGIFGDGTAIEDRLVLNYEELGKKVALIRELGLRIVATSGTYDMLHIGHAAYLEKAKACGDILVVGVDSDEKVRKRKGPHRPVVPQDERLQMLCHLRHVDMMVLKEPNDPRHEFVRIVQPDVLIVSETTNHNREDVEVMKSLCGRLELLAPQAETSTTARIRRLHVGGGNELAKRIQGVIEGWLEEEGLK